MFQWVFPNWKLIKQTQTKLKQTNKPHQSLPQRPADSPLPQYKMQRYSCGRFSRTKALPSSSQTCKVPYMNVTESRVCPLLLQVTWRLCQECNHFCFRSPGILARSGPTFVFGVVDEVSAMFSNLVFSRQLSLPFLQHALFGPFPLLEALAFLWKRWVCSGLYAMDFQPFFGTNSWDSPTHTHTLTLSVITFRQI